MKKREYNKPQIKTHIPHLERHLCNGTNGEQTVDPWPQDPWGGFNSKGAFEEDELPSVNPWKE
jgi:hypothetical protein